MHLADSQDIFHQLAHTEGSGGVKTIIENHEAWRQNESIHAAVSKILLTRLALQKDPTRDARIEKQRQSLQSLLVRLPSPTRAAV